MTGELLPVTDETLNRHIDMEYGGGEGRMSSITDAAGTRIEFDYNAEGKISTITDGRGNATALEYDHMGRAIKITYGVGTLSESIWTPAYHERAAVSYLTDPNGNQASYRRGSSGNVISVLDANGNAISSTFDSHNNVTSSTDGLGNLGTMEWNPDNTLSKITSPAGADGGQGKEISYIYAGPDEYLSSGRNPIASIDSEGNTTTYTYDGNTTHLKSLTTPDGRGVTLKWFYEGDVAGTTCGAQRGQLCKTVDAKGNVTQYGYDINHNVDTIDRPGPLGTITNTFDAAGRVISTTDGKNQTAHYTYDDNDRITQIRHGATCVPATCVTYAYDANGNLIRRVDAAGTTTYDYDAQNRPTAKTIGGVTTRLTYDGASNILSFSDPTGTVKYSYDAGNRLVSLAEPGGSCPAAPVFPNSTGCTGFEYDKNNRRTATHYPNGVTNTTVYDNAGRVKSITAKRSGGAVLTKRDYTYTVGANGKDGSLVKTKTTETGEVTTYDYDKSLRLLSATTGDITESWHYDVNNNRTVDRKTGQPNQYAAYNAADQLCWASGSRSGSCSDAPAGAPKYSYDANGNTTVAGDKTRTYNIFDQMAGVTKADETFNLSYAGPSNTERISSGATNFLNGLLGITREVTNGETTSFVRDPEGKLISMRNSDGRFYYTTDKLGSVLTLTNSGQNKAASYIYDAWGKTTSTGPQASANPWQFAGGYYEESTGRIKFGARYYNQWRGRFNQVDPSGSEQNAYLYAAANPISNADPTGLLYLNASVGGCLIVCGSVGIGIGLEGLSVGASAGIGPKVDIGGQISGGLGQLAGKSQSVECSGKLLGGGHLGVALDGSNLYFGPSFGFGGGCAIMHSDYTTVAGW